MDSRLNRGPLLGNNHWRNASGQATFPPARFSRTLEMGPEASEATP